MKSQSRVCFYQCIKFVTFCVGLNNQGFVEPEVLLLLTLKEISLMPENLEWIILRTLLYRVNTKLFVSSHAGSICQWAPTGSGHRRGIFINFQNLTLHLS